jgi:hypothetical protein
MYSRIFTRREKDTIKGFLNGSVRRDDPLLMVILSRIKNFKDLAGDVSLYVALAKTKAT